MPGFFTHYQFGVHSINQISDKATRKRVLSHKEAFCLGLQGPDIFFYHVPCYIFRKHNIGTVMHNESVMIFFDALRSARNAMEPGFAQAVCDSYICGFMGHYTLDCAAHPYIYFRSNHLKAVESKGKLFDFGNHVSLETDLDHVIMRHYLHKRPSQFDYSKTIDLSSSEFDVIVRLLTKALKYTYPKENVTSGLVSGAIKSFTVLNRAMRDPLGIKKRAVRSIEQLFLSHSLISAMIPSDKLMKYHDPCNFRHLRWNNPWNPQDVSEDSLLDIIEETTGSFLDRIDMYFASVNTDPNSSSRDLMHLRNVLLQELGDNSYQSGLPLE